MSGAAVKLKRDSAADKRRDDTPGVVTTDGGLYITKEQLERLSPGDPNRARRDLRMLVADHRNPKPIRGPTPKPEAVRIATRQDEQAVFDLLVMAHRDNGTNFSPMKAGKVEAKIKAATNLEGPILGIVDAPEGGGVAAVALLEPTQWWWGEGWFLGDLVQYVRPEHRRSSTAADLLRFERWCADKMTEGFGYPVYVVAGVLSLFRSREKERLWGRYLNPVGGLFLYPWPLPASER